MFARGVTGAATAVAALTGCAAVLVLSGCSVDVGTLQHRTSSYSVQAPLRALVVHGHLGNVDVTGGNQSSVSVTERATYRGKMPQTTHRTSGGTLTLDSNCPANETCGVGYQVEVPAAMTVTVSTGAGEIRLTGLAGQVTAHTNAGDINLSALSGPIEVTDHAGSIHGQRLSSPRATLSTSAGAVDASFSAAPAALTATVTVGSVTLHVPGGISYAVEAHSSVGSTHIGVPQARTSPHSITAHTTTGSVTVEPG